MRCRLVRINFTVIFHPIEYREIYIYYNKDILRQIREISMKGYVTIF